MKRDTLSPLALALLAACAPGELTAGARSATPVAAFTPAPGWPRPLPDLGPTHGGLAFDRAGRLWAGTDGLLGLVAFAPDGSLAASLPQFSGTHSLLLRVEQGEERLYAAHLREHRVVKLSLDGALLLELRAPAESGAYSDPAAFNPTAVAVAPDGRLFVADGYGTSLIHVFDARGRWLSAFGGAGEGDGRCNTPHGLLLDTRCEPPRLLVADRENRRLLHFSLDGAFLGVHAAGLRRPCAMALRDGRLAVAELEGRVAVLDRDGALLAVVGDNPRAEERANYEVAPAAWSSTVLCAPHGVAFAPGGDLVVADWSRNGRISRWTAR